MTDEQDILTRQQPERVGSVVRMLAVIAMIIGAFLIDAATRASWLQPVQTDPVTTQVDTTAIEIGEQGPTLESGLQSQDESGDNAASSRVAQVASQMAAIWHHAFDHIDDWNRSWRSASSTPSMPMMVRESIY